MNQVDSAQISQVRAQLEAMLLEPLFEPMTAAFGEYSEIGAQLFGDIVAKELRA